MIRITSFDVGGRTAAYADYYAHTESIVRVNFFDADKRRIGSRIVEIPSDVELCQSEIWKAAHVTPIE